MARLQYSGTEIIADQLEGLKRGTIRRIVMAGADELTSVTKHCIEQYHHVDTGSMRENVRPGKYKEELGGGSVEVYPQGYDGRGVPNPIKANVINKGTGNRPMTKRSGYTQRNKTGDKFLSKKIAQDAEERTVAAMQAEYDRIIAEINK